MNERTGYAGMRKPQRADPEPSRSVASAIVSSMAPERRAVMALAIVRQCSYRDIARQLAITEDTVKAHMREALTTVYQDVMARPAVLGSSRTTAPSA